MVTDEELHVIRDLQSQLANAHQRLDEVKADLDAERNENRIIRWMVRGIAADHAHVNLTLNACLKLEEIPRAMEALGRNCAHALLSQAKLVFKDHARMYTLRRYVDYLRGQCDRHNVPYSALGRDNDHDGGKNIFDPKWESSPYLATEIFKSIGDANGPA